MKMLALFAIIAAVTIAIVGLLLSVVFDAPGEVHAIRMSAAIAWPVQVLTFAIARLMSREQLLIGWAMGAVVRFAALAVYALVVVRGLELPAGAALISLATFLFVTMLVEPLLLTK